MSSNPVIFSLEDSVARMTLNRPAKGNAIDLNMAHALFKAALRCDTDSTIRCVVLTGVGRMFCAGGDLGLFAEAGNQVPSYLSELAGIMNLTMSRLARMHKPLLVLVNGPVAGAGLSLAMIGDIVLSARSAHFTVGYPAIGLTPDAGVSWLLPRLIGLRRAQEMILTNRRVDASEAESMGMVTRVVDDEALNAEGMRTAATLTDSAVSALGVTRTLLLESFCTNFETQLALEARTISTASASAESVEGIAAFLSKRKPIFTRV